MMKPSIFFFLLTVSLAVADQGVLTNSGGTTSGAYTINSAAANPAGALNITATTLSFVSSDATLSISATFSTVSSVEGCSGGGKGGHVSCGYSLTGSFTGTLTHNGITQAIIGNTSQGFAVGGAATGVTSYNSAYTPFYFSDSEQIHRSDDINGANLVSYTDGKFYGVNGIALDSTGRIYIADTYNSRIVRIDDMKGSNLIAYGGIYGTGPGAFNNPTGITLDSAGRIYVLDAGNNQIVRIDDMTGANWSAYGTGGSGAGQFASYLTSLAVDSKNRVYVADTGNKRIVRFDDMTGSNWTTLSSVSPAYGVTYSLNSPVAVTVDASGKIYIADDESYEAAIVRVDDITGANWTSIFLGSGPSPHSIALDSTGAVYTGGYGVQITDNMSAVVASTSTNICPIGCYYIFGLTPLPIGSPRPSAISLNPPELTFTQNVGTSGTLPVAVTNFGGSSMNVAGITATGGFSQTNNCPAVLPAGSKCTVNVVFSPAATGGSGGTLTINDNSGNAGTVQTVALSGTGTAPAASVYPASLSFPSLVQGSASAAKTVTVLNSGTGPLQIANISAPSPFNQTNTCAASVAPGSSCTVSVGFAPTATGSFSSKLTILDNAGTQTVALTGSGTPQAALSATSLNLGTMVTGGTSPVSTVTLTNHGSIPIAFSSITATAGFAIAKNTCGVSLSAGASCATGVTFTPTAAGPATGALTFTDSALNNPQVVNLSGTGTSSGAQVSISPASLQFSQQFAGTTSAVMSVTLSNGGTAAVANNGFTVSGDFAATSTCTSSLAAGKSCAFIVTFTPTAAGSRTGSLTVNLSSGTQTVSLSGTGVTSTQSGGLNLSPGSLSFSGYTIGDNPSKTITVTNPTSASIAVASVLIGGDPSLTERTTCGSALAASASCSIIVAFKPLAYGAFNAAVTLTEGAGARHTVAVTGMSAAGN